MYQRSIPSGRRWPHLQQLVRSREAVEAILTFCQSVVGVKISSTTTGGFGQSWWHFANHLTAFQVAWGSIQLSNERLRLSGGPTRGCRCWLPTMIETVLFGSIGVLAETSDIQRAYNQAMVEAGIDWSWDRDTYRRLLTISGGQARLRLLADATNAQLSEDQIVGIHRRKTEIACSEISESKTPLRPGVAELVRWALGADKTLGLVTSTYRPNIDAIAKAAGSELSLDDFAVVLTTDDVARGKPAPDVSRRRWN